MLIFEEQLTVFPMSLEIHRLCNECWIAPILCPGHSYLLRLQPIDDNYDVVLEILQNSLNQLNIPQDTAAKIMAFAASGRDGILGRGCAIYDDGDRSTEFRTHG